MRQREKPKGSMAEGWMLQESCVFILDRPLCSQQECVRVVENKRQ